MSAARRHATQYLEVEDDPALREKIYTKLAAEIDVIKSLPEKYQALIREEEKLMTLLLRACDVHDAACPSAAAGPPVVPRSPKFWDFAGCVPPTKLAPVVDHNQCNRRSWCRLRRRVPGSLIRRGRRSLPGVNGSALNGCIRPTFERAR
ncbi:hypothetical protein [Paractinoplanes rishiriensis]|uniref:Uncharacterized protein n=1 Tax=Paractinoplanes rishiriensis TaxID=1050105 RepID=A0A919K751_9ACTN|nr:hypothetical protein [Actinoplanes rishiriensis]GIF00890.1 hypothetical protein Ari01nite_83540 [Actinoplanes rishiriensis]